jgi:hypothetical protein
MTTLRNILTATALVAMASFAAKAETVSFSHTTASQTTTNAGQAKPFTDTFTLHNFDASY